MEAITYSYARENLAKTMQQACDDHEPYGGGGIHLQIFIVKTFALLLKMRPCSQHLYTPSHNR